MASARGSRVRRSGAAPGHVASRSAPGPGDRATSGADLYEQANAAMWAGFQLDTPTEALSANASSCRQMEAAYRVFVEERDDRGAGRAAVFLFKWTADQGVARGWEQRALRHFDKVEVGVERGYLALGKAGCDIHDPDELIQRAELALALAREHGDHELEVRALGDRGLALVSQGRVDEGFALLDEVMVALSAGEVTAPDLRGLTICALMTACERSGDSGRAQDWGDKLEADPGIREVPITGTHCAIVYGTVDTMLGLWESAETRLREAMSSVATTPYHYALSAAGLAELRIHQGRYPEAGKLLEGVEGSFDVAPTLARLRMSEGKYLDASALLRSYARGLGSDLMRLGPALALLIEVELKRDDLPGALRAQRRLKRLDDACNSNEIRAMARLGSARIALHRGEHELAIEDLETALTLLTHRDRPLLTAQVRLELAVALGHAGETESALVEAEAALATFVKLGVVPYIAAGQDLLVVLGGARRRGRAETQAEAEPRQTAGDVEHLTRREEEVAELVARGLSNKEVATRLFLSVRTVESHVDRILGKLDFRNRTQLASWVQQQVSLRQSSGDPDRT